jgi:hypothetical protein
VRTNAETRGFGDALSEFTTLAESVGLYVRPYTRSVMITPPGNRARYLGVVGFAGTGATARADIQFGADEFVEFFPDLTADRVAAALAPHAGRATPNQLVAFGRAVAALLAAYPAVRA